MSASWYIAMSAGVMLFDDTLLLNLISQNLNFRVFAMMWYIFKRSKNLFLPFMAVVYGSKINSTSSIAHVWLEVLPFPSLSELYSKVMQNMCAWKLAFKVQLQNDIMASRSSDITVLGSELSSSQILLMFLEGSTRTIAIDPPIPYSRWQSCFHRNC